MVCCFFQAEDGIRDLVRSRGLGDVYKRQAFMKTGKSLMAASLRARWTERAGFGLLSLVSVLLSLIHI